jgi:hypothetical protein
MNIKIEIEIFFSFDTSRSRFVHAQIWFGSSWSITLAVLEKVNQLRLVWHKKFFLPLKRGNIKETNQICPKNFNKISILLIVITYKCFNIFMLKYQILFVTLWWYCMYILMLTKYIVIVVSAHIDISFWRWSLRPKHVKDKFKKERKKKHLISHTGQSYQPFAHA